MEYGRFRYDEPYGSYGRPVRRRINYFAWTVAILLLTGAAFAAWFSGIYVFGQPERPESYRILQKLNKLDPPKRFELTAAPSGEFLTAKQLYDRYVTMGTASLAKTNAELARAYIRNFQQVKGLVPYVVGRYVVMEARELGPNDTFTSGMVALTSAVDQGTLLMEHVYPADPQALPLMKNSLVPGLEIRFERTHDLSAVIHAERLRDGRMMITAVPLLYGTYTTAKGTGTFSLDPPLSLNLQAGWPLFKEQTRLKAELRYAEFRRSSTGSGGPIPVAGVTTPNPATSTANALVRVEQARPVEPVKAAQPSPSSIVAAATGGGKKGKATKDKTVPAATAAPTQAPVVAQKASPTASPIEVASAATPATRAAASPIAAPPVTTSSPGTSPSPATVAGSDTALASTAGGGTWKTFAPGKMPLGRLISAGDLNDIAERGITGERIYLKGQFVVNFSDANRAVLRPRTRLASAMLHLGNSPTRIIVDFPEGYTPPAQGTVVSRDEARPLEITEVRRQEDGQLNVFAREIMQ
ncbi:MAG TPA: hypothetical protein VJ719_02665 [Chthoniobacterales bacterium]|nr:hypothetical protein [Chthoniobacterales bacterium]